MHWVRAETNLVDEVADLTLTSGIKWHIIFLGILMDWVFISSKTVFRIRIIKIHTIPYELFGLSLILASFYQFRQFSQTRIPFLKFISVIEVHVGTLGAFHHKEFRGFITTAFITPFFRGRTHLLSFDDILRDYGSKWAKTSVDLLLLAPDFIVRVFGLVVDGVLPNILGTPSPLLLFANLAFVIDTPGIVLTPLVVTLMTENGQALAILTLLLNFLRV